MAKTLAATRRRANVVPNKKDELRQRWNEKEQMLSAQIFQLGKQKQTRFAKKHFMACRLTVWLITTGMTTLMQTYNLGSQ